MSSNQNRPTQFQIKQKQLRDASARKLKLVRQIMIVNRSFTNYQLVIPAFNFSRIVLAGQTYSFALPFTGQNNTAGYVKNQILNKILNFALNNSGNLILADEGLEIQNINKPFDGEFSHADPDEDNLLLIKI